MRYLPFVTVIATTLLATAPLRALAPTDTTLTITGVQAKLSLSARLIGGSRSSIVKKTIPFECGE